MRTSRIFVESVLSVGEVVSLPAEYAHYVSNVLRSELNDEIVVFNGSGIECVASIVNIGKRQVQILIKSVRANSVESNIRIELIQGVSKGDRMDLVIQKSVELGVSRIIPIFTQHGVVNLDADRVQKKVNHWRSIARSACEQCGRNIVPEIVRPTPFNVWLESHIGTNRLKLLMEPGSTSHFKGLTNVEGGIDLLIGPEGGFSNDETTAAKSVGFMAIRFGPRILRTETAAIAAISAIQTLFGDMG